MRTTVNLDDDVLRAAKSLARSENRALGDVLSDLLRRGLRPSSYDSDSGDFPTFNVSEDAPPLTLEMVRRALDDPE